MFGKHLAAPNFVLQGKMSWAKDRRSSFSENGFFSVIKGEIRTPNDNTAIALICRKNRFLLPLFIRIDFTTTFLFFSKMLEKNIILSFPYEYKKRIKEVNSLLR